jgi:poly(hydroxyalkanoate) depolymerase family esterase
VVRTGTQWLRTLLRSSRKQQKAVARAVEKFMTPAPPKARAARNTQAKPARSRVREYTPPATGKWMASHHSVVTPAGPRRMSYWLYIPDRATGPVPLLVMLHGCDQSATQFAQGTRMNLLAEQAGMAVLYPQQGVNHHPHRCWKWYDRHTQQGGGDVRQIVAIVERVMERYAIDRTRVYICGLSAGAGMACAVALNHPQMFAGLGVHSGPVFGAGHGTIGALSTMQHGAPRASDDVIEDLLRRQPGFPGMPTILVQGSADTVVRPVNQDQLARQAMLYNGVADARIDVQHVPARRGFKAIAIRDVYSGASLVLRVAQVQGLAHAWSGGDARLAFNEAGGPNAGKMMLDFFARHRRTSLH